MIGATFLNLFYGRDIDGATGDWLKLVIALGVGQSFIAIADSAERILALGDRLSEDSGGIRRHMQNPESSQQEGEKTQ
jgi:hypothetical protein